MILMVLGDRAPAFIPFFLCVCAYRFESGRIDSTTGVTTANAVATAAVPIVNTTLHDATPPHANKHVFDDDEEEEEKIAYDTMKRMQWLLVFSFGDTLKQLILVPIYTVHYCYTYNDAQAAEY